MDDQQVATEDLSTANNVEHLEFLQFLKTLDDVPNEIGNVSNDDDNFSELKTETETEMEMETELEAEPVAPEPNHNEQFMDPELTIPHITISMPEGQFMGSALDSDQVIPQINISFSNLPPAPPERSKSELQQEQLSLRKHSFVHKLYLAASSQRVTFLHWSADGEQLQLDYIGLQEHLTGGQSMFRSCNVQQFTRHILDIGFERVTQPADLLEERPQLSYQHSYFKSDQPELLLQLPTPESEVSQAFPKPTINSLLSRKSLVLDSESKSLNLQSPLQMARCRFEVLLHYHNDVRLLQQQEPNAEQLLPRRGRISSSRQPAQVLTPSLASKHVNPRDSVLQFETGQVPEYAGFYGRVEPALIAEFFAEYLPRYGARISGYKDIVVDASKANSFQQNLPIGIVYSEDEEDLDDHQIPAADAKNDDSQSVDIANSLPEDIELEQVMQELCGIVPEAEEHLDNKELTTTTATPKPKLKRKKLVRKCATADNELQPESPQEETVEDLMETTAQVASCVNDELKPEIEKNNSKDNSNSNHKDDADKDLKCQTTPKRDVKRRRYDLRNSKSKRSI
ncbi:uncharacterized protein LOC117782791 [Drosophila innubila]|uniref:uncharacterized protein LOC117782791 n=1 Tax=Drosophila innubila TaxID=198719 RepID=UPI00148CF8EC|nr:uncharacterized protein LOC117782791 [Drosophila innubila]